jgi:hypothetical protein
LLAKIAYRIIFFFAQIRAFMKLFKSKAKAIVAIKADANSDGNLRFVSTKLLESELDGTESTFEDYFFSIYRYSYKGGSAVKAFREKLCNEYPTNVIRVGDYFVLEGEAAYLSLSSYYKALINANHIGDDFREYYVERLAEITKKHNGSQSLPIPINLTEGQLSYDSRVELLTSIALNYGQVVAVDKD